VYLYDRRLHKIARSSIQYPEASLALAIAGQLFHRPSEETPHHFPRLHLPRRGPSHPQRQIVHLDTGPNVRLHLLDILEMPLDRSADLILLSVDGVGLVLVELDLGIHCLLCPLVRFFFLGEFGVLGLESERHLVLLSLGGLAVMNEIPGVEGSYLEEGRCDSGEGCGRMFPWKFMVRKTGEVAWLSGNTGGS
jgi:hypothetical protein